MMNPAIYQREAERVEGTDTFRARPEKATRAFAPLALKNRAYSRQELPGGCVLYTMAGGIPPAIPQTRRAL